MATATATQSKTLPGTSAPERHPAEETLAQALGEIRRDARQRATTYGKDAIVPEGGE